MFNDFTPKRKRFFTNAICKRKIKRNRVFLVEKYLYIEMKRSEKKKRERRTSNCFAKYKSIVNLVLNILKVLSLIVCELSN